MVTTLIERAGWSQLFESSRSRTSSKAEALAAVPAAISHFNNDSLFERPVQLQLVELLLLGRGDEGFTSCIVIHGMGGTGKTGESAPSIRTMFILLVGLLTVCALWNLNHTPH